MKNLIRVVVVLAIVTLGLLYFGWYAKWTQGERVKHSEQAERMGHAVGINCFNNLEQIGLAFRIWSGDHSGRLAFNMGTNEGGTLELCSPDKNGFDENAYLFLRVISNELATPNTLVCPLDHSKIPATDWTSLTASNITYRFYSGTNINVKSKKQILAICPIDGNILYSDGTIESKQPLKHDDSGQVPFRVPQSN